MDEKAIDLLLVEDDENHAVLVLRHIKKMAVCRTVEHVRDGAEALQFLRNEPPFEAKARPSVVLLDLKLPKVDGHAVLRAIKEDPKLKSIPVIVLSTSDADIDRRQAYALNANSYLVKPVDFDQFRSLIQDLGNYWGVWNTPPPPES